MSILEQGYIHQILPSYTRMGTNAALDGVQRPFKLSDEGKMAAMESLNPNLIIRASQEEHHTDLILDYVDHILTSEDGTTDKSSLRIIFAANLLPDVAWDEEKADFNRIGRLAWRLTIGENIPLLAQEDAFSAIKSIAYHPGLHLDHVINVALTESTFDSVRMHQHRESAMINAAPHIPGLLDNQMVVNMLAQGSSDVVPNYFIPEDKMIALSQKETNIEECLEFARQIANSRWDKTATSQLKYIAAAHILQNLARHETSPFAEITVLADKLLSHPSLLVREPAAHAYKNMADHGGEHIPTTLEFALRDVQAPSIRFFDGQLRVILHAAKHSRNLLDTEGVKDFLRQAALHKNKTIRDRANEAYGLIWGNYIFA